MNRRHFRLIVAAAAAAAFAGTVALPAAQAGATGGTLTATPSTNLINGDTIQVALSAASAYEGQTVYFAECGPFPPGVTYSSVGADCGTPSGGTNVVSGAASGTVKAVDGLLDGGHGVTCDATDNGQCTVAAFANTALGPVKIASFPISFATAQTPSMTATPSTNLADGASVAVSVSNIPATAAPSLDIRQCHYTGDIGQVTYGSLSCRYLTTGAVSNHAYSTTVKVAYGPIAGSASIACNETATGQCLLAALDTVNQKVIAVAPISFEAPPVGMTVTPSTGLYDKQPVHVTLSGIPASSGQLSLAECNTTYAAANGGYPQDLPACRLGNGPFAVSVVNGSGSSSFTVGDGPSMDGTTTCDYATNGQCALVLLSFAADATGNYVYKVVESTPISFRTPVTGPPTLAAYPTSGLYLGAGGVVGVTAPKIPDGVDTVEVVECNNAALAKYTSVKDQWYAACSALTNYVTVAPGTNTIAPQKIRYTEGGVGNLASPPMCDNLHACSVGLFSIPTASGDAMAHLGNWIPISFRNPNFATPRLALSKRTGLVKGTRVKMTAINVPDLVRGVYFEECNTTDMRRLAGCYYLGMGGVRNNVAVLTKAIHVGQVGSNATTGKALYCNKKTNGQCVIIGVTYPTHKKFVQSPVIKFS